MPVMQVSRKIDYALRALIYLSARGSEEAASVSEIASHERIPRKFLEKIIQDLIRKGLVRSRRGPRGGYVLARPAGEVSFKDVIEAVDGPVNLNACLGDRAECVLLGRCGMMQVWREGQRQVMELFQRTTMADVIQH